MDVPICFSLRSGLRRMAWGALLACALAAEPPHLQQAESRPVAQDVKPDAVMDALLEPYRQDVKRHFDQPLVNCPQGLFRGRGFPEENLLGYWVADGMRRKAEQVLGRGVKFAFTNSGGLRANLRPGVVKVASLFEVLPFENELVVAEFTGAEVVRIVKDGLNRRGGEPCSGVLVKLMGTVEQPQLTVTWEDGLPILPDEVVTVATTDYLLASGDGMGTIRTGRKVTAVGARVRDLLLEACRRLGAEQKPLAAPAGGRYVYGSEALYQALRDKKLKL